MYDISHFDMSHIGRYRLVFTGTDKNLNFQKHLKTLEMPRKYNIYLIKIKMILRF